MNRVLFCPICEKEVSYTEKTVQESFPVKGDEIVVDSIVSFCSECGNEIWNEENDSQTLKKAFDIYRVKHGLLLPKQIKGIREKYGCSQSTFARALGLGEKTITRYERGSLQDRAHNGLIALAEKPDAFRLLVEINHELLSQGEYESLQHKISELRVAVITTATTSAEDATITYSNHNPYSMQANDIYWGGLSNAS